MERESYSSIFKLDKTDLIKLNYSKAKLNDSVAVQVNLKNKISPKKNVIKVTGILKLSSDAKNIACEIEVESIFRKNSSKDTVELSSFDDLSEEEKSYFILPAVSKACLILANMTDESLRNPLILSPQQITENIIKKDPS
ncbi:hypothetical protein BAU15_09130 [Enterococcus sp. JM4C]|uniref:hypothetical protein n=1 Tax=Candidatus Enterococcus huntleyi TaxID=1857217 RepID=UPI001379A480|nr:hypothetical protein [Enterococcus sp. JM4C]KAF1296798.1 hypothetical protein BAU15_09130 [Enterococcus sp. JM4C]